MSKKLVRWLVLFAFVVWQVLMPVTSVGALQGGPHRIPIKGPNGETYYLESFNEVKSIASSKSIAGSMVALASGCKSRTDGVNVYNHYGNLILRYQQKVNWCYDGTKITSVSHTHTGTVYIVGWKYNGLIADNHWGGVNQSYFRAYSQAHFCGSVGCSWN